jgi:6-pyruvoyl-tetrahydropterin synthase
MEIHLTENNFKPLLDMPYFGRQSRFYPFFKQIVWELLPPTRWIPLKRGGRKGIYAETNSGSCSNAFNFAMDGLDVITNDLGIYSYAIAKASMSNEEKWIDVAAECAALVEEQGYNPTTAKFKKEIKQKFKEHLEEISSHKVTAHSYNLDLKEYLRELQNRPFPIDVMFMDFAWPWRTGKGTEEYETTVDGFAKILGDYKVNEFKALTKDNILEFVIDAVRLALKVSKYVLLSNQSSNYPDPETLEICLLENGINYERHTLTVVAENEDNLGNEQYFREYLYVIQDTNTPPFRSSHKAR